MKLLGLKNSVMVVTVDDEFFDYLNQFIWSLYKTKTSKYIYRTKNGITIRLSREIAEILGLDLTNDIDHKDGNVFNSLAINLRSATRSQNCANSKLHKNSSTGYKGVTFYKNQKYRADIRINNKTIYLGLFDNLEDAARTYDTAARKHFGEFAALNFPLEGEQGCHRS